MSKLKVDSLSVSILTFIFLPAMSDKAQKSIRKEMKSWKLQLKSDKNILDISLMFNNKI